MDHIVFEQFATLLNDRFSEGVFTTEDSIRYTFFASVLFSGIVRPRDVIMEFPHPKIAGAEVDTYISSSDLSSEEVFEFKYHRQIPSGKNSPRPQKAGTLFKDIYRLIQFNVGTEINRTLVYVTDEEMSNYMLNKSNGLYEFFQLPEGAQLLIDEEYINSKSATFQNSIGVMLNATIQCRMSRSMARNHSLRIYNVNSLEK